MGKKMKTLSQLWDMITRFNTFDQYDRLQREIINGKSLDGIVEFRFLSFIQMYFSEWMEREDTLMVL